MTQLQSSHNELALFASVLVLSASLVACSDDRDEVSNVSGPTLSFSKISGGPVVVIDVEFQDGDYPINEVITGTGEGSFAPAQATAEIFRAINRCVPGIVWSDTRGSHVEFVAFPSSTSEFFKGLPDGSVPSDLDAVMCIKSETDIRFRPGLAANPDEVFPSDFTPFETLNAQTH